MVGGEEVQVERLKSGDQIATIDIDSGELTKDGEVI
jgi:hypothetical protein